ncbi:MAG TPA: FBP domain-containing protein [Polyangia bacterium]
MHVRSEAELLSFFREIDRADVELAPDLAFPLPLDGAHAWAVGPRAFLVFQDRDTAPPRGIVFHRNSSALPDAAAMCEWCHAVRGGGRVKLMSARASEHRRVGLYLCADLGCVERARELPAPDDLPEGLDGHERARRALRRIGEFASRRLF